MRVLALALLCAAAVAGAQVRPMPMVDDGTDARTYPYRSETSTATIRPEAAARAAREADLHCAGPRPKRAALARCRRAREAAAARIEQQGAAQAAYSDRVIDLHARAAACQAGDPDACYR